jgi:hypothetical protein
VVNRGLSISRRVREIRQDIFGENGIEALARTLKIPVKTWMNYEQGVMMPAQILLQFLSVVGVDPTWLLTGEGERLMGPSYSVRSRWAIQSDFMGQT